MQDLQSILSRVLNDEDQNVKDSYIDTLECDRSPTSPFRVCFILLWKGRIVSKRVAVSPSEELTSLSQFWNHFVQITLSAVNEELYKENG